MSTISKVFIVVNLVLSVFLLGSVAAILSNSATYKEKYDELANNQGTEAADLKSELATARGQIENMEGENRRLQNQVSDLESDNQTLQTERDQERADNNQLRSSVDSISSSMQSVQTALNDMDSRNADLASQKDAARDKAAEADQAKMVAERERDDARRELENVSGFRADLEGRIAELEEERDLLKAEREALVQMGVPVSELIGQAVPLIEAKVSNVGEGFVVLNVGDKDGVQIGYPFDVYRGENYVGRVIVDKVYPDTCTARVRVQNRDLEFESLDNATTRL